MAALGVTFSARFAGAVLAGGQSRRMGTDKALIVVEGATLVERAVDALKEATANTVVVVGGDSEAFIALGLSAVEDRWPGEGPLGGIITALGVSPTDAVVVLPCDLTDPSKAAVRFVVGALGDADVAIPVVDGQAQWLHGAWHRRALPALQAAFARGVRAPRHAVSDLHVVQLFDVDPRAFHDADSPEDLPGPTG